MTLIDSIATEIDRTAAQTGSYPDMWPTDLWTLKKLCHEVAMRNEMRAIYWRDREGRDCISFWRRGMYFDGVLIRDVPVRLEA